jgi:hypothetical protein
MAATRQIAPKTPPTPDETKEAPKALPASPLRASGYPSTTSACALLVPGTPNRIAVMLLPVFMTPFALRSRAKALNGLSIDRANGIKRTRVSGPPTPGIGPAMLPITTPSNT